MVTSYLHLLAQDYRGRLDAAADVFIAYAVDGPAWMQRFIQDLLAYWRVETQPQEFAPTDGEQVLTLVWANLQGAMAESGAVVTHDPLPTVLADTVQFVQLVQNLIENAWISQRTAPTSTHDGHPPGRKWVFAVRDNGIGLDPAHPSASLGSFSDCIVAQNILEQDLDWRFAEDCRAPRWTDLDGVATREWYHVFLYHPNTSCPCGESALIV
jgi:light-regulated signal transduction histidine kinase (bacteriophytochrome)